MARPIRLTKDQKISLLQAIVEKLNSARMTESGLQINQKFKLDGEHKCSVVYTPKAWFKTIMLIDQNSLEVGWYGVCRRDDENKNEFYVEDIMVYPQKVTGATINPDPVEFVNWENGLDDDVFNNMRIHVHSHVNMAVTPSSVDQKFRDDRLSQLKDDDFMIFQIMNEQGNINSAVYDFQEGIYYENSDVTTLVECDDMAVWEQYKKIGRLLMGCDQTMLGEVVEAFTESGMKGFIDGASKVVVRETASYGTGSGYYKGTGYNAYTGYNGNKKSGYTGYTKPGQTGSGVTYLNGGKKTPIYDYDEYSEDEVKEYMRERYGEEALTDPFYVGE